MNKYQVDEKLRWSVEQRRTVRSFAIVGNPPRVQNNAVGAQNL